MHFFLVFAVEAISTPPSQVSPREEIFPPGKEGEKQRKKHDKEMKQRAKEAERKKIKDEKKRLKEAEKEAKETRKATSNKLKSSNSVQAQPTLDDFRLVAISRKIHGNFFSHFSLIYFLPELQLKIQYRYF